MNVIRGEVNIIRYVARVLSSTFNYNESSTKESLKIDELLDNCYRNVIWGSSKDQQNALNTYDAILAKNRTLSPAGGQELGFLDFVVWSALMGNGQADVKLPNLKKWMQSCKQISGFETAKRGGGGVGHNQARNKQSPGKENVKPGNNNHKRQRTKSKSQSKSPVKNVN